MQLVTNWTKGEMC